MERRKSRREVGVEGIRPSLEAGRQGELGGESRAPSANNGAKMRVLNFGRQYASEGAP